MSMMINPSAYPVHELFAAVRDAIWEVQDQVQAPDALVAGSFLTAMSVACQGNVDVVLPTGMERPCSLYLAMFGQSGERKTTIDNLVCASIYEHDKRCTSANVDALAQYEATMRMWQAADAALQRKLNKALQEGTDLEQYRDELVAHARLQPRKPVPKRIIHQNITERPFLEALHGDGKSIAILSDEGKIVLKGGAMARPGILNKGWDGAATLTLDRADGHVHATNPRVTISFMVQEEVFEGFWNKRGRTARGSGQMARYLVAWPESTVGFRRMTLEEHTWIHLPSFHDRVTELLVMADKRLERGETRAKLEFSKEAKELWVDSQNWIEIQMRPGNIYSGIKDFASKALEIAGRIAAILHYFGDLKDPISRDTLQRALHIAWWHLNEFNRLFGDANCVPQLDRDVHYLIQHLFDHYWSQGYSQASWNKVRTHGSVRDQERFEAAMKELERQGVVRTGPERGWRGKGKRYIYLNPHYFQPALTA